MICGKCGKRQMGSGDVDFKVYVEGMELGSIGAEKSLSVALSSDKVWVETKCTGFCRWG